MILVLSMILILYKVYSTEIKDQTYPFGTDNVKNDKFVRDNPKVVLGTEMTGPVTFFNNVKENDDIKSSLNKIYKLTNFTRKDILWRIALCFSIVLTLLTLLLSGSKYILLPIFFCVFIGVYFSLTYFIRHILDKRIDIINSHILNITNKL